MRPTQKKPDGTREVLKNFHELKDGDEVVSYWPFESNSDESDMYFDGQIMSLASCPGEDTLTGRTLIFSEKKTILLVFNVRDLIFGCIGLN